MENPAAAGFFMAEWGLAPVVSVESNYEIC
jgi:hypothetical protein